MRRTWRAVLWQEGGGALETVAAELDAPIAARRGGWQVRSPAGTVWVHGGIRGTRTRLVRADGTRQVVSGWVSPEAMLAWLRDAD